MASPVAGFRPMTRLALLNDELHHPRQDEFAGALQLFFRQLRQLIEELAGLCRFTSNRSAKCEKSSDFPILRPSAIA
jgi:hypothetical protein